MKKRRHSILVISLVTVLLVGLLAGNALAIKTNTKASIIVQSINDLRAGENVICGWDWGAWDWGSYNSPDWWLNKKVPQVSITLWQDTRRVETLVRSCGLFVGSIPHVPVEQFTKGKGSITIHIPETIQAGIYVLHVISIDNPEIDGKINIKIIAK